LVPEQPALARQDPRRPGGPPACSRRRRQLRVAARGTVRSYNAAENSYSTLSPSANPIEQLLPDANSAYSTGACPAVGHERIAGRDAVHRHCASSDVWVDKSTGLILRQQTRGYELDVRSIDYRPAFPPGTFRFVAPRGARSAEKLASDPYYKTKLAPGKQRRTGRQPR